MFVELHIRDTSSQILVNTNEIKEIVPGNNNDTYLFIAGIDAPINMTESYDTVSRMLRSADMVIEQRRA